MVAYLNCSFTVIVLCSIEKQVRDVMHKAFWDALEAKLAEDPPDCSHALVLIEEVKEVIAYKCVLLVTVMEPRLNNDTVALLLLRPA